MPAVETISHVQLDLFSQLQGGALDACERLTQYCAAKKPCSDEISRKFYVAVADVESVTIEALAGTAGAFIIEDGHLRIAEEPVSKLLAVVIRDLETELDAGSATIDASQVPLVLERVFVNYVLHEVRHRTQGLTTYGNVQKLKNIAGRDAMAEYDTFADRDAALAMAALYAEDLSRAAFLRAFREALYFSTEFFFRVFPIPATRPDKIARAMSILFMAARLAKRDLSEAIVEPQNFPLDAPLYVSLSAPKRELAVHRGEPSRELLGFANDDDGVGDLITQICDGDMKSAFQTSIKIMDRIEAA